MDISDGEDDICTQDADKCLNEAVKGILILDYTKKPFKVNDIAAFLSKKPNRKMWNDILEKVKERLKDLGYRLLEVKHSNPKSFILTSSMYPLSSSYRYAEENEVADRTLIILVLAFIFMKEGVVTNVDVLKHLQQLNIYSEERPVHHYFGDVKKKIMTEFVSQLYLEKITEKDSETCEIKWGERALAEVSKRSILEFVCEIGYEGTLQPNSFVSHYRKVLDEEEAVANEGGENEVMAVD